MAEFIGWANILLAILVIATVVTARQRSWLLCISGAGVFLIQLQSAFLLLNWFQN